MKKILLLVGIVSFWVLLDAADEYPARARVVNEQVQEKKETKAKELREALTLQNRDKIQKIIKDLSHCEIKELMLIEDEDTKESALDLMLHTHMPALRINELLWGGVSLDLRLVLDRELWKN